MSRAWQHISPYLETIKGVVPTICWLTTANLLEV